MRLGESEGDFSETNFSSNVSDLIAAWSQKYVDVPSVPHEKEDLADDQIIVRTGRGFRTEIRANSHSLIADEPVSVGGTNTGPTPYDYLVAGLGACTSMTLRMYADHKGWPLDEVVVRLKHQKIHARDCETCETEEGKLDHINREIEVTGALDSQQQKRLLEIADRCPVHRTLHSEIVVESRLKKKDPNH